MKTNTTNTTNTKKGGKVMTREEQKALGLAEVEKVKKTVEAVKRPEVEKAEAKSGGLAPLMRAYEETEGGEELQSLAEAIVFSVIKKAYTASGNKRLLEKRASLAEAVNDLRSLKYSAEAGYGLKYSEEGYVTEEVLDKAEAKAFSALAQKNLGEVYDLVNEASLAILSEVEKQKARGEAVNLEAVYTRKKAARKVYIKSNPSEEDTVEEETSPIREVYRAVRKAVDAEGGRKSASSVYSYIERGEVEGEAVYTRNSKYSSIITEVEWEEVEKFKAEAGISPQEAVVLDLRLRGYGNKAIATSMNVNKRRIYTIQENMQKKAEDTFLRPEVEKIKKREEAKKAEAKK